MTILTLILMHVHKFYLFFNNLFKIFVTVYTLAISDKQLTIFATIAEFRIHPQRNLNQILIIKSKKYKYIQCLNYNIFFTNYLLKQIY